MVHLNGGGGPQTADRTTEFLWQCALPQLRAITKKTHQESFSPVHTYGEVSLPEQVQDVLRRGPKFAVEPRRSAPELLAMVRQVSSLAAAPEVDRCVSDGVYILAKCRPTRCRIPIKFTVSFLKNNSLTLLQAGKEGGFAVMPKALYLSKAENAISSTFRQRSDVALSKVKARARKMCAQMNLESLAKCIEKSKGSCLKIFFTAKTHKLDCPLRAIVTEDGT